METISTTEPTVSATPKLSSLFHTYFSRGSNQIQKAGSHHMNVQPTAISRRSEGISHNLMAQSGPPVNRSHSEPDSNVQKKYGRKEHIKPKQNL